MARRPAGSATALIRRTSPAPDQTVTLPALPAALLALLAVLAGLTACGSSSHPGTIPSPTATVSQDASALAAVVGAYDALWPAGQRAEAAPEADRQAILTPVATSTQLATMLDGIAALRAADRRTWGQVVLHPYDVQVNGDTATVQDCQNDSRAGQMNASTGQRLTHGGPAVHLQATLRRGADGAWRVARIVQVSQPCLPR